jgi:Family of unknown function (DUF5681)
MGDFPNDETKFKKGQSGNPNGRPPKLDNVLKKHLLGEYGHRMSKNEVSDIITSILSMSIDELNVMVKDKDLPFWVALTIKKAHSDYQKGSFQIVESLLDRVHGKPNPSQQQTDTSRTINITIQSDPPSEDD